MIVLQSENAHKISLFCNVLKEFSEKVSFNITSVTVTLFLPEHLL